GAQHGAGAFMKNSTPETTTVFDFQSRYTGKSDSRNFLDGDRTWLWKSLSNDALRSIEAGVPAATGGEVVHPLSGGLWYLAMAKSSGVRQFVASNETTPPDCLEFLSRDQDVLVRQLVAANPQCPHAVLEEMAKAECVKVRRAVAENPATPASTIKLLALDQDPVVRHNVAANANAPAEALSLLSW